MYNLYHDEDHAARDGDHHEDSDFADKKLLSILGDQRWSPPKEDGKIAPSEESRRHIKEAIAGREAPVEYTKHRSDRNRVKRNTDQSIDVESRRNQRRLSHFPNFEYHYDFSASDNLLGNLKIIHKDLNTSTYVQDWDEKLNLVKSLVTYAVHEFQTLGLESGSHIFASSAVDPIVTINGRMYKQRVYPGAGDTKDHFFTHGVHEQLPASIDEATPTPRLNYGRVIYIKEPIPSASRAALSILYAFTMRLQDEDFTFIRKFIQRHLDAEAAFKEPRLLQEVSPSLRSPKYYKRVTMSFHLPHILLNTLHPPEQLDRAFLGIFGPETGTTKGTEAPGLYRSCSSVILTLVSPTPTTSQEEALNLLTDPEALWTVLLINAPLRMADELRLEPEQHMTPIAQYIRGICGTVVAQRIHITRVVDELKGRINETLHSTEALGSPNGKPDFDYLFDDKSFTKSRLYHWIIKTCHEIFESVDSSLTFVQDFKSRRLHNLKKTAHDYEISGIGYWSSRLAAEITELDLVRVKVRSLKEQVLELRDALHGATAILESRAAVAQGERIQVLTYLAVAYLPIGTVSSLYSMNVLPTAATLASFFIVLSVVIAITFIFSLPTTSQQLSILFTRARSYFRMNIRADLSLIWESIQAAIGYYYGYDENTGEFGPLPSAEQHQRLGRGHWTVRKFWELLYGLTNLSLDSFLYSISLASLPEGGVYYPPTFSLRKFFLDLLAFTLLPLWITLVVLAMGLWLAVYIAKVCRSVLVLLFQRRERGVEDHVPLAVYYPPLETGNINRKLDVSLPALKASR